MSIDGEITGFSHLSTYSGLLKLIELVCNIVGFAFIVLTGITSRANIFLVASIGGIVITGAFLLFYILHIIESLRLPWLKIQFIFGIIWGVLYIGVSIMVVLQSLTGYIIAGVFGFLAAVTYLLDAYDKYKISVYT